jgi:hypothetical protein
MWIQLLPAQSVGISLFLVVAICWGVAQSMLHEPYDAATQLCTAPFFVVCLSCLRAVKGSTCCANE